MGQRYKGEGVTLELQDDDTWKLIEVRGKAAVPSEVQGKPVTTIGSLAFEYRSDLGHFDIPEGIRVVEPQGFMSRFVNSISLPSSLEVIDGRAFSYAVRLGRIDVSPDNPFFCSVDGVLYSKDMTCLVRVPSWHEVDDLQIPDTVQVLGPNAMAECVKALDLVLPDGVRRICSHAFRECERLHTIKLPESLEVVEPESFDGCYRLYEFRFPDSMTDLGKESPFGEPGIMKRFCLPRTMEELPAWFSVIDAYNLKELEGESLSIYDVPMPYRCAMVRGMATLYHSGVEIDPYAMEDCLVCAGDMRGDLIPELLENESLRALFMDKKILTAREASDLASIASSRSMVELTAQLMEYAFEKDMKNKRVPMKLEL